MTEHVYKNIEITGSSAVSADAAVRNAIERAAQTVEHMDWFEIMSTRGVLQHGKLAFWQVTMKIGFRLAG